MWFNKKKLLTKNLIETKSIETNPIEKTINTFANARALLIGINYTGTNNALNGCINDVKHIYTHLTQNEKYDPNNILMLTDEPFNPVNKQPLRKNIISGIKWLIGNAPVATEPITLFIQYSGHGTYTPDRNREEDDGRDEALCPLDFQNSDLILDDTLRTELIEPIKNNPNVTLIGIFDSCHSGSILDARYVVNIANPMKTLVKPIIKPQLKPQAKPNKPIFKPPVEYHIAESRQYSETKCKCIIFSGCKDSQTSADAYFENKSQGMLTYAFLQTIKKYAMENKTLTFLNFIKELQKFAIVNKYEQTPQLTFGNFQNINETFAFKK